MRTSATPSLRLMQAMTALLPLSLSGAALAQDMLPRTVRTGGTLSTSARSSHSALKPAVIDLRRQASHRRPGQVLAGDAVPTPPSERIPAHIELAHAPVQGDAIVMPEISTGVHEDPGFEASAPTPVLAAEVELPAPEPVDIEDAPEPAIATRTVAADGAPVAPDAAPSDESRAIVEPAPIAIASVTGEPGHEHAEAAPVPAPARREEEWGATPAIEIVDLGVGPDAGAAPNRPLIAETIVAAEPEPVLTAEPEPVIADAPTEPPMAGEPPPRSAAEQTAAAPAAPPEAASPAPEPALAAATPPALIVQPVDASASQKADDARKERAPAAAEPSAAAPAAAPAAEPVKAPVQPAPNQPPPRPTNAREPVIAIGEESSPRWRQPGASGNRRSDLSGVPGVPREAVLELEEQARAGAPGEQAPAPRRVMASSPSSNRAGTIRPGYDPAMPTSSIREPVIELDGGDPRTMPPSTIDLSPAPVLAPPEPAGSAALSSGVRDPVVTLDPSLPPAALESMPAQPTPVVPESETPVYEAAPAASPAVTAISIDGAAANVQWRSLSQGGRPSVWSTPSADAQLTGGVEVRTGVNARIVLDLGSGTVLVLDRLSRASIHGDGAGGVPSIELSRGRARVWRTHEHTGEEGATIAHIRTPDQSIDVRTDVEIEYNAFTGTTQNAVR